MKKKGDVYKRQDRYGKVIAPHFQPIRENEKLVGYVNIIKNAGRRYTGCLLYTSRCV